jgi:hypothetical protein
MTEYLNYREIFAKLKLSKKSYISLLPNDIYQLIYELIPKFSGHLIIYNLDGTNNVLTFRKPYGYTKYTIYLLDSYLELYYEDSRFDRNKFKCLFNEILPDWFPINFNINERYKINSTNHTINIIPYNAYYSGGTPFTLCKIIDDRQIDNKKDFMKINNDLDNIIHDINMNYDNKHINYDDILKIYNEIETLKRDFNGIIKKYSPIDDIKNN